MSNTNTRKLTVVRKPNDQIHLEEGEAVHVGVDVHKASYSVALFSDRRGLIATWVQPARAEVLLERLRPIREGIAQVVYEAGPTSSALAHRPGPRPLAAAGPAQPGGQERPPGLPPAGAALGQGAAPPGARPHRAGGGRPPGAAAAGAAGPQDPRRPVPDQELLASARPRRAGRTGAAGSHSQIISADLLGFPRAVAFQWERQSAAAGGSTGRRRCKA